MDASSRPDQIRRMDVERKGEVEEGGWMSWRPRYNISSTLPCRSQDPKVDQVIRSEVSDGSYLTTRSVES